MEIDEGRERLVDDLEQPERRKHHTAEPAVSADCSAMLPQRLQCSEGPSESLLEEIAEGVGRFGISDGVGIRCDLPPVPPHPPRQIHILGHRVGRVAAGSDECRATPGANGARNNGY